MSEVSAEINEPINGNDAFMGPDGNRPAFLEIEVSEDDLRQFLGEEVYSDLIESMKAGVQERQRSLGEVPRRTSGH